MFAYGALSDKGKIRANNEDSYIIDEKNGIVPSGTYFYILKTGGQHGAAYAGSLEIHY